MHAIVYKVCQHTKVDHVVKCFQLYFYKFTHAHIATLHDSNIISPTLILSYSHSHKTKAVKLPLEMPWHCSTVHTPSPFHESLTFDFQQTFPLFPNEATEGPLARWQLNYPSKSEHISCSCWVIMVWRPLVTALLRVSHAWNNLQSAVVKMQRISRILLRA